MAISERPEVADYIAWGNLVKRWAKKVQDRPADLDDLLAQCAAANVGMTMPGYVDKILVVQEPKNVFVLRLPPDDMVKETEEALRAGGIYPIPPFYDQRYKTALSVPSDEILDFHAQRTGDYVIRLCA